MREWALKPKRFIDWLQSWRELIIKFMPGEKFINTNHTDDQYLQTASELWIADKGDRQGDEVAAQRAKHLRTQMHSEFENEECEEGEMTRRWREHSEEMAARAEVWRRQGSNNGSGSQ